jgi:hypothetical protein
VIKISGEYCDIISECKQKITISGGKGNFKPYSADEPVGKHEEHSIDKVFFQAMECSHAD